MTKEAKSLPGNIHQNKLLMHRRVQYKNKKTIINRIEKNMCKLLKQRNTSSVTDPYILASVWPIFPMRTIRKANLKNKSVWCHQKNMNAAKSWRTNIPDKNEVQNR